MKNLKIVMETISLNLQSQITINNKNNYIYYEGANFYNDGYL